MLLYASRSNIEDAFRQYASGNTSQLLLHSLRADENNPHCCNMNEPAQILCRQSTLDRIIRGVGPFYIVQIPYENSFYFPEETDLQRTRIMHDLPSGISRKIEYFEVIAKPHDCLIDDSRLEWVELEYYGAAEYIINLASICTQDIRARHTDPADSAIRSMDSMGLSQFISRYLGDFGHTDRSYHDFPDIIDLPIRAGSMRSADRYKEITVEITIPVKDFFRHFADHVRFYRAIAFRKNRTRKGIQHPEEWDLLIRIIDEIADKAAENMMLRFGHPLQDLDCCPRYDLAKLEIFYEK